jgi:signal transduction histidine kinase
VSSIFGLAAAFAAGAGAAWWWGERLSSRRRRPFEELERGVRRWSEGDLAATLDREPLGGREDLAELFEKARDEQFKLLGERRREASRERLRLEALIRHIPDGLILCNLRGDVLQLNAAGAAILGLDGSDKPLDAANTVESRMKVQHILKARTQSDVLELSVKRGGAEVTATYRITVEMFTLPGADDISVLVLLRDITAERSLDAMKEEFFQAVAHDLRAPLFAMQGYLRLLEKSIQPDKHQKGYFDAITQSCEKLTLFIQDTLDSARIETGQMKLSVMPVDPAVLLQRAVELFRPIAEEKGVRLGLKLPEDRPATVDVDERLVERVFYNLLSNALRFTPRGGSITLGLSRAGAKELEFSVADTGPGIPPEERTRVFEKFRQLSAGGPRAGFGLGLNICRKIVTLHSGTIWVDSQAGQGSQFVVRLPIRQRPQGETAAPASSS